MFAHLEEEGVSYITHYIRALKFALWCVRMYFVCLVHAAFPCIFSDTFSKNVLKLAKDLESKDAKH